MPQVTVYPSSVVSTGAGIAWTNPGNAAASDNSYATFNAGPGDISTTLRATGFDFSAIPDGATLVGVEFHVEYKLNSDNDVDQFAYDSVKLFYAGAEHGSDQGDGGILQNTIADVTDTLGDPADFTTVDSTLTIAKIKAAGFGFDLQIAAIVSAILFVDAVSITVYYSEIPMSTITERKDADNVQLGLGVLGLAAYPAGSPQTFLDVGYIKSCTVAYTRELKDFESAGILVKRLVFRDRLTLTADWAEISATNMKTLIANGATGTEGQSQYGVRFGGSRAIKRYLVRFESPRDDNGLITVDIYKATPAGEFRLAFAEEEFITYPTEFSAEVDTTKPAGQRYGKITVVPA